MSEILKNKIRKIMQERGIPYLDVSCYQDHKPLFRAWYGENVTGKERLQMYSCGKPITVVAAMRLVADGRMGLDDPVENYLPEVKNSFVLDENGQPRPLKNTLTVRHLFTMSSGLSYNMRTEPIERVTIESANKAVLRDYIGAFFASPLSFEPGERFQYSLSHDVLAAVVEVVSGKAFSEYVKQALFDPLEMKNSTFKGGEKDVFDKYACAADGKIYEASKDNDLCPTDFYESGGAGLVSTVDDYAAFADALACAGKAANGYCVLEKEALQMLASEQIAKISVNNQFTCVQGNDYSYGLGVRVRTKPTEWGLPIGEYGWDGATGPYLMVDPTRKVSVVMGMHLLNWPVRFKGAHLEIVKAIYEELGLAD